MASSSRWAYNLLFNPIRPSVPSQEETGSFLRKPLFFPGFRAKTAGIAYNEIERQDERSRTMAKKLYRSTNQRMLGGVCGGLAEYFDIDVSLVRLSFVAVCLISAVLPMTLFYLIAWIVVPVERPGPQA
jgi:phage shock protein C